MSSANTVVTAGRREPQPERLVQRRRWVRGDVRCIQCARLLGRLLGSVRVSHVHESRRTITFLAYRPLLPVGPIEQYMFRSHYVCAVCHGSGAIDGVEEFSTSDAGQAEIQIKAAIPRRQGRTPGPIPMQPTTALQAALEQIG